MAISMEALYAEAWQIADVLWQMRGIAVNAQDFHEQVTVPLKALGYLADDFESDLTKEKAKV